MKNPLDTKTVEMFDMPRRRGRPSTGNAMTAAERKAKQRAKLRDAGLVQVTVSLPVAVVQGVDKFVQFKPITKSEVVAKALKNSVLRAR